MQFNLFRHYLIISHIASLSLEDEPIIELVEQYIASLQFYQQLKNESPQQLPQNPPIIPANVSPIPPIAIPGLPKGFK